MSTGRAAAPPPGCAYLGILAVAAVAFAIARGAARTSVARTAFRVQSGAEAVFLTPVMTAFG